MTKIICVGDLHISDRPPANATDTYTDDIFTMLRWISDYADSVGADAVVQAGDWFHHKAPGRNSHELVLKSIEAIQYFKVPVWCVTGNHDVSNGRVEDVHNRQPLGVLYEAGLNELVGWHPTLPLFGVPWRESWTEPGDPMVALSDLDDSEEHSRIAVEEQFLVVTHAPIYPPYRADKQLFDLVDTSELSNAMGNRGYLYYGHIHEDHGIFEIDGVTYANMGAVSRGSLHEYNLTREIKVALWTPEDGFSEVPVPHRPASEAFKLVEAQEATRDKMSLESFLAAVGQSTLDISSTGSVIEHIQGRTDVPANVKQTAIEILEEVG